MVHAALPWTKKTMERAARAVRMVAGSGGARGAGSIQGVAEGLVVVRGEIPHTAAGSTVRWREFTIHPRTRSLQAIQLYVVV